MPSLLYVLRDQKEDDMVRHEAAEALGGIASDGAEEIEGEKGEDVLAILREWAVKPEAPVVVRESCQVAIDMWEVSYVSCSPLLSYPIEVYHSSRHRSLNHFCLLETGERWDPSMTTGMRDVVRRYADF